MKLARMYKNCGGGKLMRHAKIFFFFCVLLLLSLGAFIT